MLSWRKKIIDESSLYETPDSLRVRDDGSVSGKYVDFEDFDARPFVYDDYDNVLFVGGWGRVHNTMEDQLKKYYGSSYYMSVLRRENNDYIKGRIWTIEKVISFWQMPSKAELANLITLFREQENINLNNYILDLGPLKRMKVSDYLGWNKNITKPNFDLTKIHHLPSKEKRETPQMQAALNTKNQQLAQQLGSAPEAAYNHYMRYGLGDSKQRENNVINEVDANDLNLASFKPKEELNTKFWVNGKLNSNVRIRMFDIVNDFLDEIALDWVKPEDIVFTGSLANYNWSKYSDVDIHILMDYKKIWDKTEFVEDYFNGKKELWNAQHPKLKIYGYPVELYVEDSNEKNSSTGIYSIRSNKWLVEPGDFEDVHLNEGYIKKYAAKIMTDIDNTIDKMKSSVSTKVLDSCSKKLEEIFDKLKQIRKESLSKSGEMGSGNIIWKICRRTGYIDKLWDYVNAAYDKSKSI